MHRRHGILPLFLLAGLQLFSCGDGHAQADQATRGLKDTATPVVTAGAPGTFYALVIGISDYEHLPQLRTPMNDAREMAALLTKEYGFKTEVLLNATRDGILDALGTYRRTLKESDSLLIYYAGHGYFDKQVDQAYWAPVDAGEKSYSHWIISTEITSTAAAMPARHVLVVSDSCYSGMLTRDAGVQTASAEDTAYLNKVSQRRSRNVLASGGNEPVADSDRDGHAPTHSVFANALLANLNDTPAQAFTADQLFVQLRREVGGRSDQVPQYNSIRNSSDEGGEFVFVRTGAKLPEGSVPPSRERLVATGAGPNVTALPPMPPDRADVEAALDRYEEAYASMDVKELKKVWPTLSRDQEKEIKGGFGAPGLNAVKVQLRNRETKVVGKTAVADCDQWMIYTFSGKRQPPQTSQVEVLLAQTAAGKWEVSSIKGR